MVSLVLDHRGTPFETRDDVTARRAKELLSRARSIMIKAKYDAAQTIKNNENHWANADNLDPHQVASPTVRRTLRSRSRYEVMENNAFLQGIMLTKANDFVGRSGPRLCITDLDVKPEIRQFIEKKFRAWSKEIKLRQKLWRMYLAKVVDGETFAKAYRSRRHIASEVQLDFQVYEADQISSEPAVPMIKNAQSGEVDGVKFDKHLEPFSYHILHDHPGGSPRFSLFGSPTEGQWVKERFVCHWYRRMRGWLRGIPETVTCLPLCSILRRYTIATLLHAEVQASVTGFIESEGPPGTDTWTDGTNQVTDNPFDTFPIEPGMINNLPWGYKWKQTSSTPLGAQYDHFVGSILREIVRPLMVPYGLAIGTHQDSNMASAVVDQHLYQGSIQNDRAHCCEDVLTKMFYLWWQEAALVYSELRGTGKMFWEIEHKWRWDKVGLDHTDPQKVANALATLGPGGLHFYTDRDLQEEFHNRDLEEWQEEVKGDQEFRLQYLQPPKEESNGNDPSSSGKEGDKKDDSGKSDDD